MFVKWITSHGEDLAPDTRIEGGEDAKWRQCIDNETDNKGVICGHPGGPSAAKVNGCQEKG